MRGTVDHPLAISWFRTGATCVTRETIEVLVTLLREQLTKAERGADEAQAAERNAIKLVKFATAEASELRGGPMTR